MGYLAVWKVLEEITTNLRKKQSVVPEGVMDDLKAAKTMIKIMNADSGYSEASQKIEEYLGTVEALLITEAEKHFPPDSINKWLKRLEEASCGTHKEDMEESRFVSGVPRNQKWLRVEPVVDMPIEKLKQFAKEANLSTETQKDGRILVYGQAEKLKEFIKKLTNEARKTARSKVSRTSTMKHY